MPKLKISVFVGYFSACMIVCDYLQLSGNGNVVFGNIDALTIMNDWRGQQVCDMAKPSWIAKTPKSQKEDSANICTNDGV